MDIPKIIQWHPPQILNVWEPGRLNKKGKRYEEVVWRSVREYDKREFGCGLPCYDSDAEFDLDS